MKNLKSYGVQELNIQEMIKTDGGEYPEYSASGTTNPIVYFGEAVYNFGVFGFRAWWAFGTGGGSPP